MKKILFIFLSLILGIFIICSYSNDINTVQAIRCLGDYGYDTMQGWLTPEPDANTIFYKDETFFLDDHAIECGLNLADISDPGEISILLYVQDGDDVYTLDADYRYINVTTDQDSGEMYVNLKKRYSIEYNYNGGTGSATSITDKYEIGDSITLDAGTNVSKDGVTFKGWSTTSTSTTGNTGAYTLAVADIPDADKDVITFYAVWEEPTGATVLFDLNDGEGTTPTDDNTYVKDDEISLPGGTNFSRVGYYFLGWNTDSSATTALANNKYTVTEDDVTIGEITFYAIWEDLSYMEDINLTISNLVYGNKTSDVSVSVSDSALCVQDYAIYKGEYDPKTKVTEVNESGNYFVVVALTFSSTDKAYYFSSFQLMMSLVYPGELSLNNGGNGGVRPCKEYELGNTFSYTQASSDEGYTQNILIAIVKFYGHGITFEDNVDTEVIDVPYDSNKYIEGYPIAISTTKPTRIGYAFMGWNTDKDATVGLTLTNNKYTMGDSDVTLYAIWKKVIVNEPSKGNDYSVEVDSTLQNVTYKWYKYVPESTTPMGEATNFSLMVGTKNSNTNYTSSWSFVANVLKFSLVGDEDFSKLAVSFKYNNKQYLVYCIQKVTKADYSPGFSINGTKLGIADVNTAFTLDNVQLVKYTGQFMTGETNKKIGSTTLEDTRYYCEVLVDGEVVAYSNVITPNKVSFVDEKDIYTSVPDNIYQFDGRAITVPTISENVQGYKFKGWNTDNTAKSPLSFTNNQYTMGDSDVTFYAVSYHTHGTYGNDDYIEFDKDFSDYINEHIIGTGNYILTSDVEVYFDVANNSIVNICLNGYTLKVKYDDSSSCMIRVVDGAKLTICDCNESKGTISCGDRENTELITAYDNSVLLFDEINIDVGPNEFVSIIDHDNVSITFNKCVIDLNQKVLDIVNCSGCTLIINGANGKNSNDYDIKRSSLATNTNYRSLFSITCETSDTSVKNNLYLNNVRIENYEGRVIDACNANVFIDENCVITTYRLNKTIEIEDSDLYIKGELSIGSSYTPTTKELNQELDKKSLIYIGASSSVHLYSTTVLKPYKDTPAILSKAFDDEFSQIIVEEALTNTTPYTIYSGADLSEDYILSEVDYIFGFYKYNSTKDVNDYFKIVYSSTDSIPFFLTSDKENDIVSLDKVEFVTQPTDASPTAKVNKDDATYEWYAAEAYKNKKIATSDFKNVPNFVKVEGDYFVYCYDDNFEVGFYGELDIELPELDKIGIYVYAKDGGYTFNNQTSDYFALTTMALSGYKVKLYITLEGGQSPIEVTNLNATGFAMDEEPACVYKNGYWVSACENVIDDINTYSTYIQFDKSSGSVFENLSNYTLTIVFEDDFPIREFNGVYTSELLDDFSTYFGFDGALVYAAYDSTTIKGKVNGETSSTLSDAKAGQYLCAASYDGLTIYSNVLTVDLINVSITEDAQTYTYDKASKSFDIDGNIETNFTIKYALSKTTHLDSDWSTTAPTTAGTYDVMIERAADDYYNAYSKTIKSGLVINKATATINTDNVVKSFTYDGTKHVVDSKATLNHSETTLSYSNNEFTNADTYTVTISAPATTNYAAVSTTVTVVVNPKEVSFTWGKTALIYDGNDKLPTATVDSSSLIGTDTCTVNVTCTGDHKGVGSYTATASSLSNSNYKLPTTGVTKEFTIKKEIKIDQVDVNHENHIQYFNVEVRAFDIEYDVTGTNIPASGLTIKYHDCESKDQTYTSNLFYSVKTSKYYDVNISYAEDDTYYAFDATILKGIGLYISVIYHDTDATSGSVPVDNTKYIYTAINGTKRTIALANSNNLARTGYTLDGWYYCSGTVSDAKDIYSTSETGSINFRNTNSNVHVYPNWRLVVNDITKANDYKVTSSADLTNCTYQWSVSSVYNILNLKQGTETEVASGTKDYYISGTDSFNNIPYDVELYINIKYYSEGCFIRYKSTNGYVYSYLMDGEYYRKDSSSYNVFDNYFTFMIENMECESDSITEIELVSNKEISGETNAKVGNLIKGQQAFCIVSYSQTVKGIVLNKTVTTNKVEVKKAEFNGNGANSGSIDPIYTLDGRGITLPTNKFVRSEYNFVGWNTSKDATNALSTITMSSNDLTIYAIWKEKTAVNITTTAQTFTYNTSAISFAVTGNVTTDFVVKYATHKDSHLDTDWTTSAPVNAGSYDVLISRLEDNTYKSYSNTITNGLVVNKLKVNEPTINGTYTYTGNSQTVSLNGVETYMSTNSTLTETNASDYELVYTLDSNHEWNTGSDGKVVWTIAKAKASITVDQTEIVKTYGETIVLPNATTNFGSVVCDTNATDLVNANTYTVKYTVAGTSNYDGDEKTLTVKINKALVNEPVVSQQYKYNGLNQIVTLNGYNADYMFKTGTLSATEAGVYTINISLDDNHQWANGSDGVVTWEIKAISITPKQKEGEETPTKQDVIVESNEGFTSDVEVIVEVTVESSVVEQINNNELLVDYYNLIDEAAKLAENEKVGVIFDVKLYRVTGTVKEEIPVSALGDNARIKVKMLIPEDVDLTKLTKIIHVHNNKDITVYEFDETKIDENRYYQIEIDKLSEFAFVYKQDDKCNVHWFIFALTGMLICFTIVLWSLKIRSFKNALNKTNATPVIGFTFDLALLVFISVFAQCLLCLVSVIVNISLLVIFTIIYALNKNEIKK